MYRFLILFAVIFLSACKQETKQYALMGGYSEDVNEEPKMPCSKQNLSDYKDEMRVLERSTIIVGERESDAVVDLNTRKIRVLGFDSQVEEYINYSIYHGARSEATMDYNGVLTRKSVHTTLTVCFKKGLIAIKKVTNLTRRNGELSETKSDAAHYLYTMHQPTQQTSESSYELSSLASFL